MAAAAPNAATPNTDEDRILPANPPPPIPQDEEGGENKIQQGLYLVNGTAKCWTGWSGYDNRDADPRHLNLRRPENCGKGAQACIFYTSCTSVSYVV